MMIIFWTKGLSLDNTVMVNGQGDD
jgi:hypothetical protein